MDAVFGGEGRRGAVPEPSFELHDARQQGGCREALRHLRRPFLHQILQLPHGGRFWYNAGTMAMLDGPVYRENKNVDKIDFGCDKDNIYFSTKK